MKKLLALLIVVSVLAASVAVVSADEGITVLLNGTQVYFEDQQPVIEDGRTLVPFRSIAEAMGAIVEWDDEYKVVYLALGRMQKVQVIGLQIENPEIQVTTYTNSEQGVVMDESVINTDVPAKIINDRTMVPLRFITDVFGGETKWEEEARNVLLSLDMEGLVFATDEECVKYIEENLFKAKHILLGIDETKTEADAKMAAEEIIGMIDSGKDFDALMAEYSEDPGSQSYPEGYVFTFGEMVKEFEDAVIALEIGAYTSEPVKSSYGYHIIKREALTEEEVAQYVPAVRFLVMVKLSGLDV